MGEYLIERLGDLCELGVVGEIRGKGLTVGVEFVKNTETMEPFPKDLAFGVKVGRRCINKEKMLVRYSPGWVAVAPPYIITEDEIDDMVNRLGRAIVGVLNEVRA
jgi:adenosylmethionine-8-amino-7-oxononanoate aminotransferase